MKIGPTSQHPPVRPDVSHEMPTPRGKNDKQAEQPRDWVDISDSARQKLADLADKARQEQIEMDGGTNSTATVEPSLQDGRLEQIRLKILSGFYDSREVTDRIIDRLSDEMDDQ